MLIPNHPGDEVLSALASRDTDAVADATLTTHVSACDRCTALVSELSALGVALSELPDLVPSRPLQLLPPVEPVHAADRFGGWARRFFAPVLAAGVALAMVGTIGTAAPALNGAASGPGADGGAPPEQEYAAASSGDTLGGAAAEATGEPRAAVATAAPADIDSFAADGSTLDALDDRETSRLALGPERSPWPMVLFAGIALIVAAALMRWILVPKS